MGVIENKLPFNDWSIKFAHHIEGHLSLNGQNVKTSAPLTMKKLKINCHHPSFKKKIIESRVLFSKENLKGSVLTKSKPNMKKYMNLIKVQNFVLCRLY